MQGSQPPFELTVVEEAGVSVIEVAGEVDMREAEALVAAVSDVPGPAVVDLTGCTFLGSAGLQALLSGRRILQGRHARFGVVYSGRPGSVTRVFELVGAEHLFPVFRSRKAAIESATAPDQRSGVDRRSV